MKYKKIETQEEYEKYLKQMSGMWEKEDVSEREFNTLATMLSEWEDENLFNSDFLDPPDEVWDNEVERFQVRNFFD